MENKINRSGNEDGWDKKVWCVVSLVAVIAGQHEMTPGIEGMMESVWLRKNAPPSGW